MDGISGCFRAYFRDRSITFANSMVENMFVLMFNAFTRKVHLNQYVNYFKSLTLYSGPFRGLVIPANGSAAAPNPKTPSVR
jgi:hypothetical protein